MSYINMKVKEQKAKVAIRYREAYIRYYEYDYKLGEKQKERFIETDLADENMVLSHLENQIEFFQMIAFLVLEDISFKSEESGGIYIIEIGV